MKLRNSTGTKFSHHTSEKLQLQLQSHGHRESYTERHQNYCSSQFQPVPALLFQPVPTTTVPALTVSATTVPETTVSATTVPATTVLVQLLLELAGTVVLELAGSRCGEVGWGEVGSQSVGRIWSRLCRVNLINLSSDFLQLVARVSHWCGGLCLQWSRVSHWCGGLCLQWSRVSHWCGD